MIVKRTQETLQAADAARVLLPGLPPGVQVAEQTNAEEEL